jgi:hypothetical protein
MNKWCLLLLSAVLLSCTTYKHQYVVVESNTLHKNRHLQFEQIVDDVKIIYSFGGLNMPFVVSIENDNEFDLFMDWADVVLSIDGQSFQVHNPKSNFDITSPWILSYNMYGEPFYATVDYEFEPLVIPSYSRVRFFVRYCREWRANKRELKSVPKRKFHGKEYQQPDDNYDFRFLDNVKMKLPELRMKFSLKSDISRFEAMDIDQTFYMSRQYILKRRNDTNIYRSIPLGDRGYYLHDTMSGFAKVMGAAIFAAILVIALSQ